MTAFADSISEFGTPLRERIAQLQAGGDGSPLQTLLAIAADPQGLIDDLGALLHQHVVRVSDLSGWTQQFDRLPFAESARRRFALLQDPLTSALHFIITDPFDADQVAWARTRFGHIDVHLASPDTFDAWLAQSEGSLTALASLGAAAHSAEDEVVTALAIEDLSLRQIGADDSPAIRFVNSTLLGGSCTVKWIHLRQQANNG